MSDDNIIHLQEKQVTIACGREAILAHLQRARPSADDPSLIAAIQDIIRATLESGHPMSDDEKTDNVVPFSQSRKAKARKKPSDPSKRGEQDPLRIRADAARATLGDKLRIGAPIDHCPHGIPVIYDCGKCHGVSDDDNGPGVA